jgi:hypothetical protein
MAFLMVAHRTPWDHDLNKLESAPCHINLSFSGSLVLKKIFSITPPNSFCDYLPFQENLALDLNKLEIPLSKGDLHKV